MDDRGTDYVGGNPLTIRLSSLSLEYVKVPVVATEDGGEIDPTAYDVEMAFMPEGEPEEADWASGDWETAGTRYLARCLVGPTGVILADGTYNIWLRITGSPEVPVKRVGTLVIE